MNPQEPDLGSLSLPELVELIRAILEEIEIRMMQTAGERTDLK